MFSLRFEITCSTIPLTVAANCDSSSSEILKCSGESLLFADPMVDTVVFRLSPPVSSLVNAAKLVSNVRLSSDASLRLSSRHLVCMCFLHSQLVMLLKVVKTHCCQLHYLIYRTLKRRFSNEKAWSTGLPRTVTA